MYLTPLVYNMLLLFVLLLPSGKLINKANPKLLRYQTDGFLWNTRLVFILLFIVFLTGIREAQPGTDYTSYLKFYNYILEHGYIGNFFKENELGWEYLNLSFGWLGIPSEIFFGFVSGIIWFFFIKGSYKFQFLLPLMIFFVMTSGFYFWTLNGLRQSIAIMIFFYSIKFILEKDPFKYAFWILIASLFHISVIIMLPLYFIKDINFNKKLVALLYIISIFLVGNDFFLSKITELIMLISSNIDFFSSYVKHYSGVDTYLADESRTSSGLGVLLRIVTTAYVLYKSDHILKMQPKLRIYFILFFIGAIMSNVFFSVELIGRILHYFTISFAIVVASTVYYSTNKYERVLNFLFLGAYFVVFNKQVFDTYG